MPESLTSLSPVLILLHGATLNGRMWDPVRRLLDPRWEVVTPDLPGHGARQAERYTLVGAAETVAGVARSSDPRPFVLAGDSLGGYSAMAAASGLPQERLKGLILGGCTQNFTGGALRALRWRGRVGGWFAALYGEKRLVRGSVTKLLRRMGHTQADVDALIDAGIRIGAFSEAANALANVDFRPRLAAIGQPILFFNGNQDKAPVEHEAEFVAAARNASSRRFDCEHGASLWQAREFAAMTDDFVARVCGLPARAAPPPLPAPGAQ
jgi:pimeloyl-ACP methyl ester carboxylesterase